MDVTEKQADLSDPSLYINRELSWLGFNERVLVQSGDERHPLLENQEGEEPLDSQALLLEEPF